jgi:hypothetical protein
VLKDILEGQINLSKRLYDRYRNENPKVEKKQQHMSFDKLTE